MDIKATFDRDGFVVLRRQLPTDILLEWQQFSTEFFAETFQRLYDNGHTLFPTHSHENEHAMGLGIKHGFREIVMRSPGRYELSLLNSKSNKIPCLDKVKECLSPIILNLLEAQQWDDLHLCNLSLVISTPGSSEQAWHADGGHVNLEQHLSCHVLNVFVPLKCITPEMGPTQLRPGTHYHTRNLAPMLLAARARKTLRTPIAPLLSLGDVLVFDYRILHRGLANLSSQNRSFLVLTMSKPWFKDVLNFPTRSLEERSCSKSGLTIRQEEAN